MCRTTATAKWRCSAQESPQDDVPRWQVELGRFKRRHWGVLSRYRHVVADDVQGFAVGDEVYSMVRFFSTIDIRADEFTDYTKTPPEGVAHDIDLVLDALGGPGPFERSPVNGSRTLA